METEAESFDKVSRRDARHGNVDVYYKEFYSQMMGHDSTGLMSFLWKYPHRLIEKPFRTNSGLRILELGFGEGEHLQFVKSDFSEYLATDIDQNRLEKVSAKLPSNVSTKKVDASHLPFEDETFDEMATPAVVDQVDISSMTLWHFMFLFLLSAIPIALLLTRACNNYYSRK
jgi:ubiquinone/menaquinone biosynthesis C-methylase UbiE